MAKSDRHLSKFVVRLPEEYREPVKRLSAMRRRSVTGEVCFALDAHLSAAGLPPVVPLPTNGLHPAPEPPVKKLRKKPPA